MAAPVDLSSPSRLAGLARRAAQQRDAALERCELCAEPIAADHRHLLDLDRRALLCACRACALLFHREAAGHGRLRLVGDRRLRLEDFLLSDAMWAQLRLPVDIAFFYDDTPAQRVSACYPSPAGATESLLRLEAWRDLAAANPIVTTLTPDVEALLVDRVGGARRQWIVPIDECFALVGLIRTRWTGLTGGHDVRRAIAAFFDDLDRRSRPAGREIP